MAVSWLINGGDPNHLQVLGWSSKCKKRWLRSFLAWHLNGPSVDQVHLAHISLATAWEVTPKASVVTPKGSVLEGKSPKISGKPMADRGWWYILIWPDSILSDQQINWLKCLCLKIGVWWYSSNIPAICNTIEVTCDVNQQYQQRDVYKGPWALDVTPESFALHCCLWKHCDRQQLEAVFQFEGFLLLGFLGCLASWF